jgi:hypothetical protein
LFTCLLHGCRWIRQAKSVWLHSCWKRLLFIKYRRVSRACGSQRRGGPAVWPGSAAAVAAENRRALHVLGSIQHKPFLSLSVPFLLFGCTQQSWALRRRRRCRVYKSNKKLYTYVMCIYTLCDKLRLVFMYNISSPTPAAPACQTWSFLFSLIRNWRNSTFFGARIVFDYNFPSGNFLNMIVRW